MSAPERGLRLLGIAEAPHACGIPDLVVTVEVAGRPVRFALIGHELVSSAGDWAAGYDGNGTGLDADGAGLDSLLVVVDPLSAAERERLGYEAASS